jgi:hypothetical protein
MVASGECEAMNATGRPTKLDDLTAKRICDDIEGGSSRACAAGLVGVGVSTLYGWMASNPEFRERVRAADAHAEEQVVSALFALATDKTRPHFEAIKFWLKTRRARTWREMLAAQPPAPANQDLTQASEEELVAAVEQWLAQRKLRAGSP